MIAATTVQLPRGLQSYMGRYARRRDWQRIVRRAGLAMLITLLWMTAWCLIDRAVALSATARLILLAMNGAIVMLVAVPAVGRLAFRTDWRQTAREIERREPDWRERLATLTSRTLGPSRFAGSHELLAALAADVDTEAVHRSPADLLPWSAAMRPWIACVIAALSILSLAVIPTLDLPRLIRRYAMPLANVAPAATTRLFVTPGDVRIAAGDALRVRTSVQRMAGSAPMLHVRPTDTDDWIAQPMSSTPQGAFEARVPNLERDVEYFVTGGDARSEVYRAIVLHRPAVVALRITLTYPPYLKLPPRQLSSADAALEAPAGTEIAIEIQASEPLSAANVVVGEHGNGTSPTSRSNVRRAKLVAQQSGAIAVHMTSAAGVAGEFIGGRLLVIPDRPPVVTVEPATPQNPPPRLNYHVVDDLALARIDAEISRGYGEQKIIPLSLGDDVREQSAMLVLDGPKLSLAAGEVVDVQLRAEDRAGHLTVTKPTRMSVSAGATTLPAAEPAPKSPQTLDPTEFKNSLDAYFQLISRPSGR